jgi:hypothetical protein
MRPSDILIIAGLVAAYFLFVRRGMTSESNPTGASVWTMAAAIQKFEGWYPGSRSYRNNNPGNIRWFGSKFPSWMVGATGTDESGHVIFDTVAHGTQSLVNLLTMAITGKSSIYKPTDTIYDFFGKYAEANQSSYANSVASALNMPVGAQIGGITV